MDPEGALRKVAHRLNGFLVTRTVGQDRHGTKLALTDCVADLLIDALAHPEIVRIDDDPARGPRANVSRDLPDGFGAYVCPGAGTGPAGNRRGIPFPLQSVRNP